MIFKFFIFIILLVLFALIGFGILLRRIKNAFGFKNFEKQKVKKERKDDNVIYNKDDIVVLKGEADTFRKSKND